MSEPVDAADAIGGAALDGPDVHGVAFAVYLVYVEDCCERVSRKQQGRTDEPIRAAAEALGELIRRAVSLVDACADGDLGGPV